MSGLAIKIGMDGFGSAERGLARLNPLDTTGLLTGIARLLQQQTRRRIEEEKSSPDGGRWKPNRAGTSTLYQSGALARSIDYAVSSHQIILGSGLVYSAIHQFGGVIRAKNKKALAFQVGNGLRLVKSVTIPARPYIGVSASNASEVVAATVAFLRRALA